MSTLNLNPDQMRLLGAMIEKQLTTPATYPMTLNSIKLACNQKSNRDPVVEYDDDRVFDLVQSLEKLGLVEIDMTEYSRTTKYRQLFAKQHQLGTAQLAIMTELLVRGPQTPGELRQRGERMHRFKEASDLDDTLNGLAAMGLIKRQERQPGTKEARWTQTIGPEHRTPAVGHHYSVEVGVGTASGAATLTGAGVSAGHAQLGTDPAVLERLAALEAQVAELSARLARLARLEN